MCAQTGRNDACSFRLHEGRTFIAPCRRHRRPLSPPPLHRPDTASRARRRSTGPTLRRSPLPVSPRLASPGQSAARVIAQHTVILARAQVIKNRTFFDTPATASAHNHFYQPHGASMLHTGKNKAPVRRPAHILMEFDTSLPLCGAGARQRAALAGVACPDVICSACRRERRQWRFLVMLASPHNRYRSEHEYPPVNDVRRRMPAVRLFSPGGAATTDHTGVVGNQ